ncbi:PASTA domain-containing protein [candidate division WOR-3 bacterium]|nr:PASTA domain-containing protein [candidate division WOR-3 bacterium]
MLNAAKTMADSPASGQTLRDLLAARGYVPEPDILKLFVDVARSLEAGHGQAQLHLDVKPEKIVKALGGRYQLAGFGSARLGTPKYMAPERVQRRPVTAASDIYSFGVTLYEAATGKLPFDSGLSSQVLQDHVKRTPPLPQSVRPGISAGLQRIIVTALAKNPGDRFRTAGELREALELELREQQASIAQPAGTPPPAAEPKAQVQPQPEPEPQEGHRRYYKGTMPGVMSGRRPEPGVKREVAGPDPVKKPEPKRRPAPAGKSEPKTEATLLKKPANGPAPKQPAGPQPQPAARPEPKPAAGPAPKQPARPQPQPVTAAVRPAGARKRPFPVALVAVPAGLVAVVVVVLLLAGGRGAKAPRLVGLSLEQAREAAARGKLVLVKTADRDDTLPAGQVLEQEPPPGARAGAGETLQVVVSTGMVKVPELARLSLEAARQEAARAGLRLARVDSTYSNDVPAGQVTGSQPGPGARVESGSAISLAVAAGRASCPECGARREPGAKFCTRCGFRYEI